MAIEDDDKPRKKITHEIGQDLSLLSVEELAERIALMASEIERLQAAMTKKRASKEAAKKFFQVVANLSPPISCRPCESRDPYAVNSHFGKVLDGFSSITTLVVMGSRVRGNDVRGN